LADYRGMFCGDLTEQNTAECVFFYLVCETIHIRSSGIRRYFKHKQLSNFIINCHPVKNTVNPAVFLFLTMPSNQQQQYPGADKKILQHHEKNLRLALMICK